MESEVEQVRWLGPGMASASCGHACRHTLARLGKLEAVWTVRVRIYESRGPSPSLPGLAPPEELETDEVPDSLVSDFSSLTTPYCWVITEDAVAGYDGAAPSTVGKSGPDQAVADDVTEALNAGRFFRLVDGRGHELAIGRLYDPSGENELAPLDNFGRAGPGRAEHRVPLRRRLAGGLTRAAAGRVPHSAAVTGTLLRLPGLRVPAW